MKHTVSEIALKTGARGLFIDIPDTEVMTFQLNFRAGEYLVLPEKYEAPHLMEHVLLGANELIPRARDFQAELEKNGAYSNASTSCYDITYEAECADFEWDRILGLMLAAITRPLFLEEEFKSEFGNVQEEMAARSNNHFRRLSLEMRQAFGLVAKPDAERLRIMDNVGVEDVRNHYQLTHFSPNMRFVIAGQLPPERREHIINLLEQVDLPTEGKRFELPHELPVGLKKPIYVANDTVENLYFYIDTFTKQRLTDAESDALNLANVLLTETLYSRILGTARERGLVYGMNSGVSQTRGSSNWWFGAQVSDKNIEPLLGIIRHELERLMNGDISPADLTTIKQYALGRHQRGAQRAADTADAYAQRYFFDGVIENYYQVPERIEAVTKDQIVAVCRAMFKEAVWGFGVLGSCGSDYAAKLQQQLAPLWEGK